MSSLTLELALSTVQNVSPQREAENSNCLKTFLETDGCYLARASNDESKKRGSLWSLISSGGMSDSTGGF
ncbi:Hypothetical predicted protein [Cloeon dipterum]|uniref:Uncharacterized protein n=1 Tax=Cloeon dipterum TaxID=197152 RepID=A0A8S1CG90_9INSE|nr:Hypothetical predicted protein [Cloeon dipterum]